MCGWEIEVEIKMLCLDIELLKNLFEGVSGEWGVLISRYYLLGV